MDQGEFANMGVQDMMKLYYSRLFPHQDMYKWLSYGNDGKHPQADASFFQRREFCFTLDGDIFVRYQSFKDCDDLATALQNRCPSKIDLGPVYTVDPQRRAAYAGSAQGFSPVERELVFDIDLTDYDDVRTCGQGGHICTKCWPLMAAAIQVLNAGLRQDFGFKHILFVFSGRRGVHCWVCDERARKLSDEQRAAVASYFSIYKGQERGGARLATTLDDHPAVSRAYGVLYKAFETKILPEQALLEDGSPHQEGILNYIPSESVRESIKKRWMSSPPSTSTGDKANVSIHRWTIVKEEVEKERDAYLKGAGARNAESQRYARMLTKGLKDIVFAYTYPRLDIEVSKKMNHLLKAPFCVHPKTGKVCVPIDPAHAWEFNPEAVATVGGLLHQLNERKNTSAASEGEHTNNEGNANTAMWQTTDMADAVGTFRACLLDGLLSDSKELLAEKTRAVAEAQPALAW
jgi:DNA primase small subunit